MCGIVGYLNLREQPAEPDIIRRMAATVAHRGPDGEGIWCEGPMGLGHRRLSIMDLTDRAVQPMQSADGRFVLSYNGEIYNFRELRAELAERNHHVRSTGDAEVVLEALACWGEAAISRFNGMFSLALWDRKTRTLLLARDRYGIKPLYWAITDNLLVFGSEVKAILAHPSMTSRVDKPGLIEYFTFQNFIGSRTLFQGISLLEQGSTLSMAFGKSSPRQNRYWDFDFCESDSKMSDADYEEQFDGLFRQAVQRQLVSDVEVGTYLSGGMDTGAITAIAARSGEPCMKSFTVGFDTRSATGLELAFDERPEAEHMSYLFQTEHYEIVLKAGDMERAIPPLIRHLEEPRVGQCYPNFYASKLASRFVKVVLSGTGGDELFGGYPWRYYRAIHSQSFESYIDTYYDCWQRLVPSELMPALFAPIAKDIGGVDTRDIFKSVFHRHASELTRPEDYVNHSLYFEAKTFLHGLLMVEDKLGMAHGLEARLPFLDNDLVDFAMRLPVRLKLTKFSQETLIDENEIGSKPEKYFQKTNDGKLLLRRSMSRYMPQSITQRAKQGFSGPDASWFRGDSIDFVRSKLLAPDAPVYNYLDFNTARSLIEGHLEGRENRRLFLWSLLCFNQWLETFGSL